MCLMSIKAYQSKLHLRLATRITLRGDSEGGAEDEAVADAAPDAAIIGVGVTLRLLFMMLRCIQCLNTFTLHPCPGCGSARRRSHSMPTWIQSLLVNVQCVLHCTETAPYTPAPSDRAASARRRICPRRQGLYHTRPLFPAPLPAGLSLIPLNLS